MRRPLFSVLFFRSVARFFLINYFIPEQRLKLLKNFFRLTKIVLLLDKYIDIK